jgi:hypothetical protein
MPKTASQLLSDWSSSTDLGFSGSVRRGSATAGESEGGGIFSFKDVAMAPLRGVEGFVEDVYGLADTLTFDALPNYDLRAGEGTRFFGQSDTVVGGLVEGITSFAVGFIPVAGMLGKAGKFGNLIDLTTKAERAAQAAGRYGKAAAISAGRGAVAGAAVDFAAFDGNEERLSNLIESVPALQNPISGFLAAEEDDPELIGRLKNVLEGAGVGSLTDTLVHSLKSLKRIRGERIHGKTPQAAALDEEAGQIEAALNSGKSQMGSPAAPRAFADSVDVANELNSIKTAAPGPNIGQTFNPDGAVFRPGIDDELDIVTLGSINMDTSALTPEALQAEANKFPGLLQNPGFKLGAFRFEDGSRVSIDMNVVIPSKHRRNTYRFAKANGQDSFGAFVLEPGAAERTFQNIPVGGDGNTRLKSAEQMATAAERLIRGEAVDLDNIEKGIPQRNPKANYDVQAVANSYAATRGIPAPNVDVSRIQVDEENAKRIADAFEAAVDDPNDPAVRASFDALAAETRAQYEFITTQSGLKPERWTGKGEPYASSAEMAADIRDNNHLWFYATEEAFGEGKAPPTHPLYKQSGLTLPDGTRLMDNDLFRVVHDYFGHAAEGNQFGARGEEVAWTMHSTLYSDEALPALTTETRGQNSWVNFGPQLRRPDGSLPKAGEADFVPPAKRRFADQKAAILPEEFRRRPGDPAGAPPPGAGAAASGAGAPPKPPEAPGAAGPAPDPSGDPLKNADVHGGTAKQVSDAFEDGPGTRREALLRSLGVDEARAREIVGGMKHREALLYDGSGVPTNETERLNPRALSPEERLALELERTDLNFSNYQGSDGALGMLRVLDEIFGDELLADVPGIKSIDFAEQTQQGLSELVDLTNAPDRKGLMVSVIRNITRDEKMARRANARILAYKSLLLSNARSVHERLTKIRSGDSLGEADMLRLYEDIEHTADLMGAVNGLTSEQGRGLGANRMPTHDLLKLDIVRSQVAKDLIEQKGGNAALLKALQTAAAVMGDGGLEGAAALAKLAQAAQGRGFVGFLNEYWINALLSSPKTWTVNAMSGAIMSVYKPLENALGGSIGFLASSATGNSRRAREYGEVVSDSLAELTGLLWDTQESMKHAATAMRTGDSIIDPGRIQNDSSRFVNQSTNAISARAAGASEDSMQGRAIDWFGRIVRVPSSVMTGADELIKQKNYRSVARSHILRKAMREGVPPESLAEYVQSAMDKIVYQGQALSPQMVFKRGLDEAKAAGVVLDYKQRDFARDYTSKFFASKEGRELSALSKVAVDRAEEVTFQKSLQPGTISADVQRIVASHPVLRFVMPFVRTPLNVLAFSGQRLDAVGAVQLLAAKRFPQYAKKLQSSQRRLVQDALSSDPAKKADALGRYAAAVSVGSLAISYAASGAITGRGPKDPAQRKQLQDAGWQEYSFRVGDKYVSYARLDPFATAIGTMADIMDYGRFASEDDQQPFETLATGSVVALANNFTNKSYLAGLSNVIDAMQDPERKIPTLLERYAGSFVPAALAHTTQVVGDDHLREVNGMLEAARSRTPGMSDDLSPMRNVLGEPVTKSLAAGSDTIGSIQNLWLPIAYREVSDDVIRNELANLGHGFSPPRTKLLGMDIRDLKSPKGQTAHDRWSELHGTVRVGNMTLRQRLLKTMNSASYKQASPETLEGIDSPRIQKINTIIQDYRRAAYRQLLREFPAVAAIDREAYVKRRALKAGRDTRVAPTNQPTQLQF